MELVSPCKTAVNKVVKTMHPQGNSASLSQPSHIPQSLTNLHTSQTTAHNYSSQHSFSLTVSTMNQNSDQTSTSNHPVANPAVGQSYSPQKSNNTTSVSNSQPHTLPQVQQPAQPIANTAPQIVEQPLPEKSHANGTTEGEPSHKSFTQSGLSLISRDKPAQTAAPAQAIEVDPLSIQENAVETSSMPIPAKTENESVASKSTPEISKAKSAKEVPTPKEADGPPSSSTVLIQVENDKPFASSAASSEKEQDPLYQPESDSLDTPDQISQVEVKTKQGEHKIDLHKNVGLTIEAIKVIPSGNEIRNQKESPDGKNATAAKSTPRKTKNTSQEQDRTPVGTSMSASSSGIGSVKRQRIRTQHYQSPLPEVEFVSKISSSSFKNNDEKLIVFYKNEFLAVRNAEGSFYLCQAVQNIYKSSPKIKIRWLSQDKNSKEEIYTPDFYDAIDFDCILTNLSLNKADKGKFILPPAEKTRTESILSRSLAVEKGEEISSPSLTEEHPDGLDLSLYRDEDQLKKRKATKRRRKASPISAPKPIPTKKIPKVSKVRKVEPPAKPPAKKVINKKKTRPVKKIVPPAVEQPKPVASVAKTSKVLGKVNSKASTKTSSVVDQKKAKVLARIGRKPASPAVSTKPAKSNSKNEKPGNKAASSSNKTVQQKASSNSSVKTTSRSARKSTRK